MYRNQSSFDAHSVKESVKKRSEIVRRNALRTVRILFTFVPMLMLYNAARAGSLDIVPQKIVNFKDLNLNTPEGAAALYRRLTSAAYDVCASPYRYDLSELKLQTCIRDAVSRAIDQVNRPLLSSIDNGKTRKAGRRVMLAKVR
jgi:UrcA family protein